MISLKHLKYALAIKEYCHFKKAADACAISQSALSSAISDMEKILGFQIFERDNKKVLITPLGRKALEKAHNIFIEIKDLQHLSAHKNETLSGELAIGVIPTIAPYILPLVLSQLQRDYPELNLIIEEDQSQALLEQVITGHLDTAIVALPYDCQGLLSFEFWQEDFYYICHAEDAPHNIDKVSRSDIEHSRLMLLKEGHCLKDHALSVCSLSEPTVANMSGTSLNTMIQLVSGQLGTTLIPEIALSQLIEHHPNLVALPLDEPSPHRRLAFVVRPNYPGLESIESLKSLLIKNLRRKFN